MENLDQIQKLVMLFSTILALFIPIITTLIGIIIVRKAQKRKEEAEAKLAEVNTSISETQLIKIKRETKDVILDAINEPTIKEISDGYTELMKNFKTHIECLQEENIRIRSEFMKELNLLKEEIKKLKEENEKLKEELEKTEEENNRLKRKLDNFIKKTNKKNNQEINITGE